MNIRPVDRDFFRFVSRIGKRKLVIELDGDSTKEELCEAFTAFLNASGYYYSDHIECVNQPPGVSSEKVYEPIAEEDLPF